MSDSRMFGDKASNTPEETNADTLNLLELPHEILHPSSTEAYSITSSGSADENQNIMRLLSRTCQTLYGLYKPTLDEQDSRKLLTFVLNGNLEEAHKLFTAKPHLLFIESTAHEQASGFIEETDTPIQRKVRMSPIRAMAAAGDIFMLNDALDALKDYVSAYTGETGHTIARKQLHEQFHAYGMTYPKNTYDFRALCESISNDALLKTTGEPNDDTQRLIKQFRAAFIPTEVTSGFLFNINELINAVRIYLSHLHDHSIWEHDQLKFFWSQVIGYLERLLPAFYVYGVSNHYPYYVRNAINPIKRDATYLPLDESPDHRLGIHFGIDRRQKSHFDESPNAFKRTKTLESHHFEHRSGLQRSDLETHLKFMMSAMAEARLAEFYHAITAPATNKPVLK